MKPKVTVTLQLDKVDHTVGSQCILPLVMAGHTHPVKNPRFAVIKCTYLIDPHPQHSPGQQLGTSHFSSLTL